MTNIKISEDVIEEFTHLVKGINTMPESLSKAILSDLFSGIDTDKANKIINLGLGVEILEEEELIKFFKKVYNFTRSEKFTLDITSDSITKIAEGADKEVEENMVFDKDEIMAMAEGADNAQDGVIIGLIFDGVSHENGFQELINLTEDDIDLDFKKIHLPDRTVDMSEETALLVKDAINHDTYYSINGETARKYKITEGKNILRGLRKKLQVKAQIISQRILRIADNSDYKYLNATTISHSGQLHYAIELINRGNNIDDATSKILKRFGIKSNPPYQFDLKTEIEDNLLKNSN